MPTIVGWRGRGYAPRALQLFAERIGVTKSDSWIDYSTLEGCLREDLDPKAPRASVVLDPLKLVITNWDALHGAGTLDDCHAPVHPHHPELGQRQFKFGKELWIERGDLPETPPKGSRPLTSWQPGASEYGPVITCTGAVKDVSGQVLEVHAEL
jgi:glutaminyl-tRNA synthetase